MWEQVLNNDPDKQFLLKGLKEGFRLTSDECKLPDSTANNDKSANNHAPELKEKMDIYIKQEIAEGKLKVADTEPQIVSPIFALPKSDGSIRLIQDCSKPCGKSLNDKASCEYKIRYQSVQDAVQLLKKGYYMCKIDLKSAYRSVPIHPSEYSLTGIKHTFLGHKKPTFLYNTRLIQGAKLSPMIFHRLSQAVKRYAATIGIKTVAYLDDYLIISADYNSGLQAQHKFIHLIRNLGFHVAWHKVQGPSQRLTFLGIELNSEEMSLTLPPEKIADFKQMLTQFQHRKRASRKQLEQLCGKLSWAATVVRAGRSYLRRAFDMLAHLRKDNHKILCTEGLHLDIHWWINVLNYFPGKRILCDKPVNTVYIDASDEGSGFMFQNDWGYVNWKQDLPEIADIHINVKETLSAIFAVRKWGRMFQNSKVLFLTDNTTACANISKGTSRNPIVMPWLRELHWASAIYNFEICSIHIPGQCMPADDVSRLHNYGNLRHFMSTKGVCDAYRCAQFMFEIPWHMSIKSAMFVLKQVIKEYKPKRNWTS